ncbi:hypothetical protein NLG97_g2106 [Lecanicillium saksenae]|uniref:Uncharacterized protein n=1 Tax=Lecanicillium saksenae TaxID=468837 RepID=A0ACC1R3A4_9HYPO|nr:hypothetical protein NLG97_g2106 [Lecanicillium saksenae]
MDIKSGSEYTIAEVAKCSNEAFADYFGHPIVWTPEQLESYLPNHCISMQRSLVASPKGSDTPAGFCLMAYRDDLPGHARLAGMGVTPSWAGKGVGSQLIKAMVEAARAEGTHTIWLEVITLNTAAIKLYTKAGFEVVRQMGHWKKDVPTDEMSLEDGQLPLEESTPQEVLELTRRYGAAAEMPWQMWHQFALATSPENSRAFKLGQAYCAISDPEDDSKDTVSLQSLVVVPEARGKGQATALLRAVMAKYPGKKWKSPAVVPREFGDAIAKKLGFTSDEITLDLMKLTVN